MKVKRLLPLLFVGCVAQTMAQTFNEWRDPEVNEMNRAPMHTSYFAFGNEKEALMGDKTQQENYLSLNGLWKFNWVKDADMRPTDFYQKNFDDSKWGTMPVPGLWELNGYGDPIYINVGYAWREHFKNNPPEVPVKENHVGSYRRTVVVPDTWKGKQVFIHLGSVTSNVYLWVNGRFVGYSEDSKLEAEFDVTPYLKKGENLIAFQTFRWCDGTYLEDQDFFRLSGVGRDCYLYAREKKRIQDIRITPELDEAYRDAQLAVQLDLQGKGQVNLRLLDAKGKEIASTSVSGKGTLKTGIAVQNPKKWTAETPYLYTLLAEYVNGKEVKEVIPVKVGFRKVEIKNGQLCVNGQPVLIKGANRHEMDPNSGYVVSRERMLQDIRIMKEMNINAVRTCHYPDDAYWYELCDKYGIYMVAEANIESHGMGYGDKTLAKREDYRLAHLQRDKRNVQRNFNHPSVIIWSMGNEAGFGPNFEECYRWTKKEDPSRPVMYERAEKNEFTDIYCPMYLGYEGSEKYAKGNDPRPLIQCEYAHAMGNSQGGFKEYWDLVRKYPKYQGGFIWDFVDQSLLVHREDGKTFYGYTGDWNDYDSKGDQNFCNNGLIAPDRTWNPHAYEVQRIYQSVWTEPKDLNAGKLNVYNEYAFRNLDNYYMVWTLLADGKPVQSGTVNELNVAPGERIEVTLPYTLYNICPQAEVLLNTEFRLKKAEPLLEAGFTIAKNQLVVREGKQGELVPDKNVTVYPLKELTIDTANEKGLVVGGNGCEWIFGKNDGFLCSYVVNGAEQLAEGGKLTPNFWRAPTDNDMGANLHKKMAAWNNPGYKLMALDAKNENGYVVVTAKYQLEKVAAELTLTYTLYKEGAVKVNQTMKKTGKGPDMFRFGMQMQVPAAMEYIEYYGRGPVENYSDRKSAADLGIYKQTVTEQFYSYIRPQENGNKCDVRWWKLMRKGGYGLKLEGEEPLSVSALHYSIGQLDDGKEKNNRHSELLVPENLTNWCIDKVQLGLGCVTSWGAVPRKEYRIPMGDYSFTFLLQPIR